MLCACTSHGGSWKGKFVLETKGSLGCWVSLGTRPAAPCSFCGPGQLAKDHLPSPRDIQHTVVSLCPSPWQRSPDQELWVLCDSAGQQAQLGPLEFMFFALLTLKILNNSRFRSSQCIWNISDSLIALVSRHQPKITLCCGTALLWMEQNCTKPLMRCRDAPAVTSGGNSPVCCQPWPGQGDTGARGSWCRPPGHPPVTAMARGVSSLFLTPRPVLPGGRARGRW